MHGKSQYIYTVQYICSIQYAQNMHSKLQYVYSQPMRAGPDVYSVSFTYCSVKGGIVQVFSQLMKRTNSDLKKNSSTPTHRITILWFF